MKRLIFFCLLAASASLASAREQTPASDSRITYVGRTLVNGEEVSFDWSGVYARIRFTGGYLALTAGDSGRNYYNVWIDREPSADPDRIVVIDRDTTVVLFSSKIERKPRVHDLVIQKRTEGEQGRAVFRSFETDGSLLQAEGLRERVIEFIGDSYTCGYGSENSVREDPFRPEDENPAKTYADILCRYFGADGIRVSHSGQGVDRNYNDAGRGYAMPDRYLQAFDLAKEPAWDFRGPKPDITLIYLGTNDFSTGRQPGYPEFREGYLRLLRTAKQHYGDEHPILCVVPRHSQVLYDYIRDVVQTCGLSRVYLTGFSSAIHDDETDLGASWHPNYSGHLKKAYSLVPVIATITGWPIQEKVLR